MNTEENNMNSYERIYNILTESTPLERVGSKKVGQEAAKDIAKLKPAPGYPIDVPERYAQDDIRATAKEKGDEAIRTGKLKVRLKDKKQKDLAAKHKEYDRAVKAGVAGMENRANWEPGPRRTIKDI